MRKHVGIQVPGGIKVLATGLHGIVALCPCGCVAAKLIVGTSGVSGSHHCRKHPRSGDGYDKVPAPVYPFTLLSRARTRLGFVFSPASFGLGIVKMNALEMGVSEYAFNFLCFTLTIQRRKEMPEHPLDRILASLVKQAKGQGMKLPNFDDPKLEERVKSLPLRPN
jgi:hypothetical protein